VEIVLSVLIGWMLSDLLFFRRRKLRHFPLPIAGSAQIEQIAWCTFQGALSLKGKTVEVASGYFALKKFL